MGINIPQYYRELRATVPFDDLSIGYASIHLAPISGLEEAQRGYAFVPEGDTTNWRPEWLVIGNEGRCGDPIFIDTSNDKYPVYTAVHGTGDWSPELVASTFQHFIQIFCRLQQLAKGRANPVELEKNPVTRKESEAFLEFIRRYSPDADLGFWQMMYET